MTKKDYIKAAQIVSEMCKDARSTSRVIGPKQRLYEENVSVFVAEAFVKLFKGDNPRFSEDRFLEACQLGDRK